MSGHRHTGDGGAAVSLGDVTVNLKVQVDPQDVVCTLTFRGTTISVSFDTSGALQAVGVPEGHSPRIENMA
jgi:hypothetical protein